MMISICNPLMTLLQKRLYLRYWKDEVDEVLMGVNGKNDRTREFIMSIWGKEAKVVTMQWNREYRQGYCFDELYSLATGDILITMDDDNFIYKKGVINKYASMLENNQYDSVGSFGFHAYPVQNAQEIMKKYRTVRLNPFLSFWKREIIEKTSKYRLFSTFNFEKGSNINKEIIAPCDGWLDAMGRLSVEYFLIAPRIFEIASSMDGEFVHFGGMSSIYRRFFKELENTNEEVIEEKKDFIFKNRNIKQIMPYWVKYHALYNAVKNDIPFKDYKEKFELLFGMSLKILGIDIEEVERESAILRKNYPNLFI